MSIIAWGPLMRGFRQTDFDDRIIRHIGGAGGRERRKLPQLVRREGDDFHVLPEQHHGVDGHGYRPVPEAEKPTEVDHHHDLAVLVANDAANPAENVLALDRAENLPPDKIADANRLGETHGRGL